MLHRFCLIGFTLVAIAGFVPSPVHAQAQVLIQAPAEPAATQPTSQPAQINGGSPQSSGGLVTGLARTGFGKVISGEQSLTWDEVLSFKFWQDNIKDLIATLLLFIPRFIGTVLFLFVFWLIYRGIRKMIVGSMKKGEVDSSIRDLLGALIKWAIMGFGIVIACNQLGIPIVAMLTGVSIIGLAVGFAAQETLANFIAGIVIFLDKPFKVGDWIQIADTYGQVKRVSFRSTRMLTLDGEIVVFPNTQMLNTKLVNRSTNPINRVSVPIGIAYKESIDQARAVLLALTTDDSRLVNSPAPEVVVKECADSSVNLLLRFWITDESIEHRIGFEYTEKIKKALDEAGIEIPFPHMQLFVENTPAVAALAGNGDARGRVN